VRALFARYPQLAAAIPHIDLGVVETPLELWRVEGRSLLIKRDDLDALPMGGNKVRALEVLLARARRDTPVLTIGSTGSTHALATALYAQQLGATCEVITWPQEEHAVSLQAAERLTRVAHVTHARSAADAFLRATLRRMRRNITWVPAGGSSPIGALGHVSATLELLQQLEQRGEPLPAQIVLPLGSGGTVAGVLVGLSIARSDISVLGVRVVPRIIGNRGHVLRLAWQTHALIRRYAGTDVPRLRPELLRIEQGAYGGAYARVTAEGDAAARALAAAGGPSLDGTYSAKAFGVALRNATTSPDRGVLFWLTFDARWLTR
jgi:D-cysteine desulfhydrase